VSVQSKGKHRKEKLGLILAFGKARISSVEEDDDRVGHHIWQTSRSPDQKNGRMVKAY
jgi:hypothetical protein